MLNALLGGCVAPGKFVSRGFGGDIIFRQSGWMLTILVIASLAIGVANSQANQTAAYQRGYTLGLEAYKYGLPLVTMQWTFQVQTSSVPVNQFDPFRAFATPNYTTVVAPNFDTLYSIAWLDLSKEPQVIYVPNKDLFKNRFFVIPLYDPYTENFENLGSVNQTPEGYYAVVGPKDAYLPLPKDVTRIKSRYDRVWIIERIYANNDNLSDINYVNTLQNLITLTPLSKLHGLGLGLGLGPPAPANPNGAVNNPVMPTGMAYYDQLCRLLQEFPPPVADNPELTLLAQIGVGPGRTPSTDRLLSSDTVAGMIAAVAAGPEQVLADAQALYAQTFVLHDGFLVVPGGTYGTNYQLRAVITQIGLGALTPDQAIYPLALLDRTGKPLTGASNYTVHIAAGGLPPVNGFWSITSYTSKGTLIPNPINRYVINDRSNLTYNPDGSVDLYLQSTSPSVQQNWLPTPVGAPFELIWRLYATVTSQIPGILNGTGWQPPAVMPVG